VPSPKVAAETRHVEVLDLLGELALDAAGGQQLRLPITMLPSSATPGTKALRTATAATGAGKAPCESCPDEVHGDKGVYQGVDVLDVPQLLLDTAAVATVVGKRPRATTEPLLLTMAKAYSAI